MAFMGLSISTGRRCKKKRHHTLQYLLGKS
ncbi:hypothetical protein EY918_06075 [Citrobacter braakii]|nr:hypothetical protein EY918_06075 [Citrobacter braakii]